MRISYAGALIAALTAVGEANAGVISDASVTRTAPNELTVTWADKDPVDIFMATNPQALPAKSTRVSVNDRNGKARVTVATGSRPYILLTDRKSGQIVRTAERLIPLQQGSNFRDIGGYMTAEGKHVRWGRIFRSGATPMLTEPDKLQIAALGINDMVDLRSNEERVLAPSNIGGIRYAAVGYSLSSIMAVSNGGSSNPAEGLYRTIPHLIAPQMRIIFEKLLQGDGPLVYNCSAGQDRTGFATAMVLTALGVPRQTIYQDYLLSTAYRRPQFEMAKIDTVAQANNRVAMFFARMQQDPAANTLQALHQADGTPFLSYAFDEIEARWGSTDRYLEVELGMNAQEISKLRESYTEH